MDDHSFTCLPPPPLLYPIQPQSASGPQRATNPAGEAPPPPPPASYPRRQPASQPAPAAVPTIMAEGSETPTAPGAESAASINGLPPAVKVDVTEIAKPFREEVRRAIQERYGGVGPKLVAFLANTVRGWDGCACLSTASSRYAHIEWASTNHQSNPPNTIPHRTRTRSSTRSGRARRARRTGSGTSCASSRRTSWRRSSTRPTPTPTCTASSSTTPSLVRDVCVVVHACLSRVPAGYSPISFSCAYYNRSIALVGTIPGFFPSFYGGSMDDYLRDTVSYTKDVGA